MDTQEQSVSTVTTVDTRTISVTRSWSTTLHHKNLARSIGAIASLSGAVSVLVGALAAHMAPHGWRHVKLMLHLTKKPLLMQLAPFIAGFAITAATAAGLLSFYSWYRDVRERRAAAGGVGETSPR
jgi:hypothetical protein